MSNEHATRSVPLQSAGCCDDGCCGGDRATLQLNETAGVAEAVRTHYGAIAADVLSGARAGCCDSECCGSTSGSTISAGLYQVDQLEGLPLKAALASLGCGNPTALAELHAGETVLDLGSGGGIDVLISARRVGATGHAYGLDMTDAMLELARRNADEAGATNVSFLKGDIAAIPLPDNSVDVIISNCVINLAVDKAPVLKEAFRVLKPGGRFAVSDIVIHGELPAELASGDSMRRDLSSWSGCIAGALTDKEYRAGLAAAGFTKIELEVTRRYGLADVPENLTGWAAGLGEAQRAQLVEQFASTFVRAVKPSGA
jgi:ubiquinone/menaquinone biosynthesis C-methylase UbiE